MKMLLYQASQAVRRITRFLAFPNAIAKGELQAIGSL
jgi:hypothetical protein